ncbi:MAG: Glutamyl-tRNA(Gln) amidotransferase subunit E [Nitrosopumilales archaeon]|nr:MAG: Glutamyl-tRNA(Gln) amidotransferase subunit E [Nitrosopumilales archaeon]
MSELKIDDIGLKVGLEIHQQLSTNKKLFCNCFPAETDEFTSKFSRKLRASKSELGEYDPAALFESTKSKTMVYYTNPGSSCLVERDEEPPHELDLDAKNIAVLISCALNSNIFGEIYPMRKIVIDGSNTSGFQRTLLVSQGGYIEVNGKKVGVQSICLEEDAAKLLKDKENVREFSLDRLGIPLVEIALEPVSSSPSEIRKIALSLGRLLRTTRKVTRGLGSIRQDVNVSVNNSGVVEVKGVQQLDQLEKVVEYEAKRQHGLLKIAQKIKQKQLVKISRQNDVYDIINLLKSCKSKIIQKAINDGASIHAIKIKNFAGMLSYSPYEGIRLGKELGQLVRFFGIGGIFHLDELPNYGIEKLDIEKIKEQLSISQNDSFIIIAGKGSKIDFAIDSIINRIEDAKNGVPAETRLATQSGETVFLRPRPGASRMYPETDIFPVKVTKEEIEFAKKNIPKSWHESLADLQKNYQLNPQLAEQIFDSNYLDLFEKICSDKLNSPNFVASILCSTITNLERQGLDSTLLKTEEILKSFDLLIKEKITKESMEIIFEKIMAGEASSVEEAIQKGKVGMIDDKELEKICETIIKENQSIIDGQGLHSIGALMGLTMKMVRGKASGEKVNQLLKEKIQNYLDNKK